MILWHNPLTFWEAFESTSVPGFYRAFHLSFPDTLSDFFCCAFYSVIFCHLYFWIYFFSHLIQFSLSSIPIAFIIHFFVIHIEHQHSFSLKHRSMFYFYISTPINVEEAWAYFFKCSLFDLALFILPLILPPCFIGIILFHYLLFPLYLPSFTSRYLLIGDAAYTPWFLVFVVSILIMFTTLVIPFSYNTCWQMRKFALLLHLVMPFSPLTWGGRRRYFFSTGVYALPPLPGTVQVAAKVGTLRSTWVINSLITWHFTVPP